MKKNVLKRPLAMLLALVMLLSAVPMQVLAAKGDIIDGEGIGFDANTLNQNGVINWPIKIYDYLNDGMLFEPANSRLGSSDSAVAGMVYAGGRLMPTTTIGEDFTVNAAYSKASYTSPGTDVDNVAMNTYYTRTRKSAVRFENPQYLRLSAGSSTGNRRYFLSKLSQSYAKDTVRYAVLVYRSKGIVADANADDPETGSVMFDFYAGSADTFRAIVRQKDSAVWVNSPDQWQYVVVDLSTAMSSDQWSSLTSITSVNFMCPIDSADAYFDISHLAFFDNAIEAENYGEDAAAFDNDPGEYLADSQTITLAAGTPVYYTYPTVSAPAWNFRLDYGHNDVIESGTENLKRYGMNFTDGSGKQMDTYAGWSSGAAYDLYVGSAVNPFTPAAMTVDTFEKYVSLSNSSATSSEIVLAEFNENEIASATNANRVDGTTLNISGYKGRYLVLVYRATGYSTSDSYDLRIMGYGDISSFSGDNLFSYNLSGYITSYGISRNVKTASYGSVSVPDGWVSEVIDLSVLDDDAYYIKYVGMKLPTGSGKKLDLAYVSFFGSQTEANTFATDATAYMNQGIRVQTGVSGGETKTIKANRGWNMGNNLAYGLLFASDGPGWTSLAGGNNTNPNGYYAWAIGEDQRNDTASADSAALVNAKRKDFAGNLYTATGGTNNIYMFKADNTQDDDGVAGYNTSDLAFDGYSLKQIVTHGWLTAGMLEGGLVNGKPVYRQETVEYLANLLYETLVIPPFDDDGDYNFNFVKGDKSSQYAMDINDDGDLLDSIDLTGDTYPETKEASMDLATALRVCLGISFTFGQDKGTFANGTAARGTYADTLTRADGLMGSFADAKSSIITCVDAAYYLLNNLFVEDSYNQLQDDYGYLSLSSVTLSDGRNAYVFDAGYTTGSGDETEENYAASSQSALVFSPRAKEENGQIVYGDGTISLGAVGSKDMVSLSNDNSYATTRFPFLPVTDTGGDYRYETESYYFADDGILTLTEGGDSYEGRNFNYVMASNGEFVYMEEENLFFEFEGDDDVYLFLNGQLVLDIGGAHGITKAKIDVNEYVTWARDEVEEKGENASEQAKALALTEGEICQFDFYYMERHGYGANCRIVTNMHVTDPKLKVEKSAQQFGEQITYGGVVDSSAPIGYTFKMTNTGNTKLYNLNFVDDVIGVTLDPQQGLVIKEGWNGLYVFDSRGGTLEASDLTAIVTGITAAGLQSTVNVTFADNTALINFLKSLRADGTESGQDDAEVTNTGSGLWVDATMTITGMHYLMNASQVEAGMVHNTVYVTATTKMDPTAAGNQTLRSDASHRVFTSGAPVYYQWAGHKIFLSESELLNDATGLVWDDTYETIIEENQLTQYSTFFKGANKNIYNIYTTLCDKKGNSYTYSTVSTGYRGDTIPENWGFFINYLKSGSYTFYVLMYLNASVSIENENGEKITGNSEGTDVANLKPGTYAIIPVTVTVADVKDSTFVLDYGLGTESLDMDGELFNQDELFGSSGSVKAKLMGLSTAQPGYLDAEVDSNNDFNRISFDNWSLSGVQTITPFVESGKADGVYNVNLNIPAHGRPINYDSNIGGYTIVGAGTMTINAVVPTYWTGVKLHYWYDGGEAPVEWPGTSMEIVKAGEFTLDIPGNVTNIIISNAADESLRSVDLHVTAGVESTIQLSTESDENGNIKASVICSVSSTAYITVPEDWGDVYLYSFDLSGVPHVGWPGTKVTQKNANGEYVAHIPGDTSKIVVSNGGHVEHWQTTDLDIDSGRDVWIDVLGQLKEVYGESGDLEDKIQYYLYRAAFSYSQDPVTIHAKIPETWGDNISLYAWYSGTDNNNAAWPGQEMTLGADGWYELDLSGAYGNIIITDGVRQTQNLLIEPGMETWLTVEDAEVRAEVPSDWGSNIYLYAWKSNDKDVKNGEWPGVKMTEGSDGYYHLTVNGEYDRVIINNNGGRQTEDLVFAVNQDTTITVNTNGKVHANVSALGWSNANLYAWNEGSGPNAEWPGQAMSYSDGWYTLAAGGSYGKIIINNGSSQTENLTISPDAEVKVILDGGSNNDQVVAKIKYVATVTGDCPVNISYTADGSKEGISFTPNKIMSNKNVLWMAVTVHSANVIPTILGNPIDINNEVQMYKKITVLPANVVYYEDDFVDITYNTASTTNSFTHHGSGSGSLTQSVAQDTPYGSDPTYQAGTNALTSGDSLTKVQIKGTDQVAAFTFTGTGFELISRTNAFDSATIIMKLYEMQMVDGVLTKAAQPLKHIPVITEFDNGGDGGTEEICQVPVIRVNDLDHGTYLVEISGNPAYDFSKWDGDINSIDKCMIDTYLYIDGIRVFQPLGEEEVSYNAGESDALFWELRNLIVAGKVAVAQQDGESFQVSAGTTTWTENLRGDDFAAGSAAFVGNQVGSVNDYLIQGPNNEVYMDGTVTDTALAFLVTEQSGTANRALQIALRALDYGKFYGVGSTGPDVRLEYGIRTVEGDYRWRPLVNAVSSAEQYYSIPYEQCPKIYDEQDNFIGYQVAIRAVNGQLEIPALVSYTTLKTQGLEICSIPGTGEKTFLYYENGILVAPDYFLQGTVGSNTITKDNLFWDGKLTMTFAEPGYVYFSRLMAGETRAYQIVSGDSAFTAADAAPTDTVNMLYVPAGEITFTLTEKEDGVATLTYTVAGSGETGGETQVAEVNLNLYALRQQMIAGSMEDGEVNAGERVQIPEMNSTGASLSFDDEIHYNFYYTVDDAADVEEMGLAIFADRMTDGIITDAIKVLPGYYVSGERYVVRTHGIPAKEMGDNVWFKIYAKLSDGTYAYSDIAGYNAVYYAKAILAESQDPEMKALVVAMLNYGAAAQEYFGHNTDSLMNAGLTEDQKALVDGYSADMLGGIVAADSSKTAAFPKDSTCYTPRIAVGFEGAFAVNYYFTPKHTPDGELTMYYWDAATYNSISEMTRENATSVMTLEKQSDGSYLGAVEGIAAKEVDSTIYVALVYTSGGTEYCSGILAYSLGTYFKSVAGGTSTAQPLGAAVAVYSYCAKCYFEK